MLEVRGLRFAYPAHHCSASHSAVGGVTWDVKPGEILAILGPSGCGKTTILNLLAGLLTQTGGQIISPAARNGRQAVGYVFQSPSLIPWLPVRDNALFGFKIAGGSNRDIPSRCASLLGRFGLAGYESAFPNTLSGGMQQRVSVIRAVLSGAHLLLLDEPFSNSDFLVRLDLQRELARLVDEDQLTAVLVTHDIDEAVRIADKIVVLTHRPARVKGEVCVSAPRSDRLSDDPIALRLIAPYVEKVWQALKASDEPAEANHGVVA